MKTTGRIFMKFRVWVFENLSRIFQYHWNLTRITGTLHEDRWTDFHEISYLSIRKFVENIPISLKSDKNNGHFTWRPLDGFSWNFVFEYLFENLSSIFKYHWNLTRITGTLHEDHWTYFHEISYLSIYSKIYRAYSNIIEIWQE